MSYYIQRIRMAELYRDAADVAWEQLTVSDAVTASYERVLGLDQRLLDLSHELPDFLRFDKGRDFRTHSRHEASSQLQKQKLFIFLMITARRCKLHLPYLLRSQQDTRFRFSRETSLGCAREMLKLSHLMSSESSTCNIKLPGVFHHFFIGEFRLYQVPTPPLILT